MLWSKNPDEAEIQTMLEIASQLDARVRGDDFETFLTPTETFSHPDDKTGLEGAEEASRHIRKVARRKQWTLKLILLAVFALLAGLVVYFEK